VLRDTESVAVLTGAGVSAESGVPTFREAQTGLWAQYDPQSLATPTAFQQDPRLVWEWYTWRRKLISSVDPNAGHVALAELAQLFPRFALITQNVDGLHQRAGSIDVIELHGNIHRTKCFDEDEVVDEWNETGEVPPRCPRCAGRLRPDVVWFGENLPHRAISSALHAVRSCGVFFSVGTSALVQPAAALPVEAIRNGAVTIEINPKPTPLTEYVTYSIQRPSGQVLPEIVALLKG
jgi:NAD-dependent deacetylase